MTYTTRVDGMAKEGHWVLRPKEKSLAYALCKPAWFPCRILESQLLKRWWMGRGPKRYTKSRQGCPHLTRAPRLRAVSIIPWTISSKLSAALRTAGVQAYGDKRKPIHETRPLRRGR